MAKLNAAGRVAESGDGHGKDKKTDEKKTTQDGGEHTDRHLLEGAAVGYVAAPGTFEATALGAVAAAAPKWRDHALLPSLAAATAACLADEAPPTRAAALGALSAFGPMASAAHLDAVAGLLEDEAAAVRVAAVGALGRLGSAESHAEALSELLGDPDRGVRGAVTGALKQWEAA